MLKLILSALNYLLSILRRLYNMVASIWNPGPTVTPPVAAGVGLVTEQQTLTAGQTVITLTTFTYVPGTGGVEVYVNGVWLTLGQDYSESSSTTITLVTPVPAAGADFKAQGIVSIAGNLSTAALKIVLLGDSLTSQNAILNENIPHILERVLQQTNVSCTVRGICRDGHTFYRANTVAFVGTLTAVEACIAQAPDIVLLSLGANDAVNSNIVDNRTLTQIKADAYLTISTIKAALPNTNIIYVSEVPYDTANFTVLSTLKNKAIFPSHQTLRSTGILAGYYTSEILEDIASTATTGRYQDWKDFDAYVKLNTSLAGSFPLDLWKIMRMGGAGNDGTHLTHGGNILAAGYLAKGLHAVLPSFANMISNNFGYWEDPDFLFSQVLTPVADGYAPSRQVTSVDQNILTGRDLHIDTWHLPLDTSVILTTNITDSGSDIYSWSISGGEPGQTVKVSANGLAFSSLTNVIDSSGRAQALAAGSDVGGFSVGANVIRYAVGNISLAPQTAVFAAQTITRTVPTLLNSWTAVSPSVNNFPVAFSRDRYKLCRLQGVVTGGASGSIAFILPVGYRPPYAAFPTTSGASLSYLQINPTGEVYVFGTGNISLDGVTFMLV
jgi:lysophospholipase L1-like esterase